VGAEMVSRLGSVAFFSVVCLSVVCVWACAALLQLLFYTQSMLIMGPVFDATKDASKAYNVSSAGMLVVSTSPSCPSSFPHTL